MNRLSRVVALIFIVAGVVALQSCANHGDITSKNRPATFGGLKNEISDAPRTVLGFTGPLPLNDAFVGLALSGGGSRAANFSLAVMQELDQMGLMQQVDAISTVSGGSVAGAYYALHSEDIDWRQAKELMRENFIDTWTIQVLRPDNIVKQFVTDFDRSDIMASRFDNVLFKGATFSSLGALGPRRPKLFINATNSNGQIGRSGADGVRFVFNSTIFKYELNSDIGSYPIASAVMASAAFPGVFNRVTVERFDRPLGKSDAEQYRAGAYNPRRFVHLMDGGPADNLGVETLIDAAFAHFLVSDDDLPSRKPGPCLLILADAYQPHQSETVELKSDPRGALDHFIDTDFFESISVMLAQRREDTLSALGVRDELPPQEEPPIIENVIHDGIGEDWITDFRRIGNIRIYYKCMGERSALRECYVVPSSMGAAALDYMSCKVWHLGLAAVRGTDKAGLAARSQNYEQRMRANGITARIVDRIPTHFKLKGPKGCSPRVLQAALYQAASFLTRDRESVKEICAFASEARIVDAESCASPSRSKSQIIEFPIAPVTGSQLYSFSAIPRLPEPELVCSGDESFIGD